MQGWTQYGPWHILIELLNCPLTLELVILGATNPLASAPGTIRGDYAIDVGRNVCHGSDGVESAKKEIDLWFKKEEIMSYEQNQKEWVYEK
jgi:nucleoside-diphosphate kinase